MEYLNQIANHWISVENPEKYDVVAMSRDIKHPNMIQHFGVYLGEGKILHTLEGVGSHIAKLEDLSSFIKGYYRWH